MNEKISLSDKLQEMEHSNLQLASETETIGMTSSSVYIIFV